MFNNVYIGVLVRFCNLVFTLDNTSIVSGRMILDAKLRNTVTDSSLTLVNINEEVASPSEGSGISNGIQRI